MTLPENLRLRVRRTALAVTLSLGLLVSGSPGWAQPPSPPASNGASSTSTAQRGRLDATGLQQALDGLTAGAGVGAVAQVVGPDGRWSSASGVRRLRGPAAQPRDQVRIASVTKSMVATLALQEVQRGHWRLSTRVDDVLPGLLPGHGQVTLAQLLSHRSGAPDYLTALLADAVAPAGTLDPDAAIEDISTRYTDRQLVRLANTLPWGFTPGSAFGYSNTNYVVVGMMLARATGQPVRALLERRVFRPAGMDSSRFARTARIAGPHLTEYATFDRPYSLATFEPSVFSSAGAVVSTVQDVNRFYRALISGRLLRPSLVRVMQTPLSTEGLAYGLGIYAVTDPCPTADGGTQLLYGHDGASFGTLTVAFSSPNAARQVAVSVTGRVWDPATPQLDLDEFLVRALLATCPNPPAESTSADRSRTEQGQLRVPQLDLRSTTPQALAR